MPGSSTLRVATLGGFAVTVGALELGMTKAFLIIGMVYLSRCTVGRHVPIPGKTGVFVSAVFAYFEAITERRHRILGREDDDGMRGDNEQCGEMRDSEGRESNESGGDALRARQGDGAKKVRRFSFSGLVERLDEVLLEVFEPEVFDGEQSGADTDKREEYARDEDRTRTALSTVVGYVSFVVLNWAAFVTGISGVVPGIEELVAG